MQSDKPQTTDHTPGPWVWRWKSGSLHQVGTDRPYGATVLTPTYGYDEGIGIEVSDADDHLIAAAPDLLEALELVWDTYGMDPSIDSAIWQTARAAIAKARGVQNV